jgi:hypothetical protein
MVGGARIRASASSARSREVPQACRTMADFAVGKAVMKASREDPFSVLDWTAVRRGYDVRAACHARLLKLHRSGNPDQFAKLALGIADAAGNFSAWQYGLGPKILAANLRAAERVLALAGQFLEVASAQRVPPLVREADLAYLRISVGSELSCMMHPRVCWIANVRTIWTHLLIKHDDSVDTANEALHYYRAEESGEMAYKIWRDIHRELDTAMTRIAERAEGLATGAGTMPGPLKYLWADAVADAMYGEYHG